jgi:hypothetical protein
VTTKRLSLPDSPSGGCIGGTERKTAPVVPIRFRLTKPNARRQTARIVSIGSKLSLQRSEKFREGMGNVCVSGLLRTTATNPKQEKEIKL